MDNCTETFPYLPICTITILVLSTDHICSLDCFSCLPPYFSVSKAMSFRSNMKMHNSFKNLVSSKCSWIMTQILPDLAPAYFSSLILYHAAHFCISSHTGFLLKSRCIRIFSFHTFEIMLLYSKYSCHSALISSLLISNLSLRYS
jgi:hypothetical protein